MNEQHAVPAGWECTTLGDIRLDKSKGVEPSKSPDRAYELYSVPSFETGLPELLHGRDIGSNKQAVEPGTVLLCKINPRINRAWVVGNHSEHQKIASTEWIPFFQQKGVMPHYLAYFLRQESVRDFLAMNASGVGGSLMRVTYRTLAHYPFPLAPLAEQRRIVAAIEQQFTRLDAGVAALKRAQVALKRYHASVLKAAVEGQLTEQWRAEHPDTEPASQLLARILAERRTHWEADLRAKGKDPAKAHYDEPEAPDITSLPASPEGWAWATVAQMAGAEPNSITDGPFGSNLKTEHYTTSGMRVIRLQNVGDGEFRDEMAFIAPSHFETLTRHQVYSGDIIIAALGNNPPRSCIIPDFVGPAIVKADCIRFKVSPLAVNKYVNAVLNADPTRKRTAALLHGIGRPRLNLDEIKSITIPLPPVDEQVEIASEVDQRLSVVSELEAIVETQLKRAERLRQSILERAFSGQLVPQDPDDEPAALLLERIQAERAAVANGRELGAQKGESITEMTVPLPTPSAGIPILPSAVRQSRLWEPDGS